MSSPSYSQASPHWPSSSSAISYFAPPFSLNPPHFLRTIFGPRSRNLSGSHVCQTCGGSTTWSSTLMILGSSATTAIVPRNLTRVSGSGAGSAHQQGGRIQIQRVASVAVGHRHEHVVAPIGALDEHRRRD